MLNAYIREHSLWKENSEREENQLPQDIQAVLFVLGRLLPYQVEEEGEPVDLSYTDLRGCNLVKAPLKSANLRGAHLEKASLHEVHLEKADLHLAHLERAELISANLKEAVLSRANLTQATALSVNLEKANLNLAILDGASLQGADFSEANLVAATLDGALLQGMRLPNQYGLEEMKTDLREARGLHKEQIIRANGDDTTLLPEGLPKPIWWSKAPSSVSPDRPDPLSPGEYSINVLKVALSFVVDEGWSCRVARWPDILQLCSEFGNLQFVKIKALYDLSEPSSASTLSMPDDPITWLQGQAHPYLRTEEPYPVSIGDVQGTAIDILVSTSPAPPRSSWVSSTWSSLLSPQR